MQDLIILGADVHPGEMVEIVERMNAEAPTWNLLGFVVAEKHADKVGEEMNGYSVLDTAAKLAAYPNARFAVGYGFPKDELPDRERLVSLIDPSCHVSRTAAIGPGCVLYPHCFVGLNAVLGERVFVLSGSCINHDDVLEEGVCVTNHVALAGFVHVEADCYLGQACTIRQNLRIGRNSLIGMGSAVVKDVEPNSVMAGNPARKIKERESPKQDV